MDAICKNDQNVSDVTCSMGIMHQHKCLSTYRYTDQDIDSLCCCFTVAPTELPFPV